MPASLQDAVGRLGRSAVPAGNLQAAVQSGRYLSPGSAGSGDLSARILQMAGLPAGTAVGTLGGADRSRFLQAALAVFGGMPKTMLSSRLGHAGLFPGRVSPLTRLMGDGVPASSDMVAASYALGGSPLVSSPSPPPAAAPAPDASFPTIPAGPFAGQIAYPGGPFGMPEPPPTMAASSAGKFATPAERFLRQGRYWR